MFSCLKKKLVYEIIFLMILELDQSELRSKSYSSFKMDCSVCLYNSTVYAHITQDQYKFEYA